MRRLVQSAAAVALTLLLCSCGNRSMRVAYIEACMNELPALSIPAKKLGEATGVWLQGEEADVAEIEKRHETLKAAVENLKKNVAAIRERGVTAPEFDAAFDEYVVHLDEQMARGEKLLELIRSENPPGFAAASKAHELLLEGDAREKAVLQLLALRAQEAR
ncbi:MAG: hypothetical protein AAF585_04905 [Verrucomicrobiota bacterium]